MSETFDALDAARKLKDAGMERPHTEAVAAVVRDSRDGLATKAGIDALRVETKAGIDALRVETKADIDALRVETKADIDALRVETKAGMDALRRELATHRWVLGLIASMCMATLAGVVVIALQL